MYYYDYDDDDGDYYYYYYTVKYSFSAVRSFAVALSDDFGIYPAFFSEDDLVVDEIIEDDWYGFSQNRSATSQIFCIYHILKNGNKMEYLWISVAQY
jgi:hypothetical protein